MQAKLLRTSIALSLLTAVAGCDSCAIFRPIDAELADAGQTDLGGGSPDVAMPDQGSLDVGNGGARDMPRDQGADLPAVDMSTAADMGDIDLGVIDTGVPPSVTPGLPGCGVAPLPAAPTITVGDGTPGSCTETALLAAISGGNVIAFDCGAAPHTIALTQEIPVTTDVTLIGNGLITLDGGGTTRMFRIEVDAGLASPHLQIFGMELTGGYKRVTDAQDDCGAAVYRYGGTLTIVDSDVHDNYCDYGGAAVPFGGAIAAIRGAGLYIYDSTFTNNAAIAGGGIYTSNTPVKIVRSSVASNTATERAGGGLALFNTGPYELCGCDLHDNNARWGGGLFVENNSAGTQDLTISQSNISRNSAIDDGGAGDLEIVRVTIEYSTFELNTATTGGALWLGEDDSFSIANSTFLGNSATDPGGAIFATDSNGAIVNVTFSGNTNSDVGAALASQLPTGALDVFNTIFIDNVGLSTCDQQFTGATNIQFPTEGISCTGGIDNSNPMLSAREDVGNQTVRRAPAGSPAVDAGGNCPVKDQVGALRSMPCTVGAVEVLP